MSETLGKLQAMVAEQFGMRTSEIEPDSPLQDLGMDSVGLEQLRRSIEEIYTIDLSVMLQEHYNIDMIGRNMKDQTLRELAVLVDQTR